jgi:hypothetical protein
MRSQKNLQSVKAVVKAVVETVQGAFQTVTAYRSDEKPLEGTS